jgi:hypothetical protein
VIQLKSDNEYREGRTHRDSRKWKSNRIKNNLSSRVDLGPTAPTTTDDLAIPRLNVITEITKIAEAQLEIPTTEKTQKRQREEIWASDSEKKKEKDDNNNKGPRSLLNSSIKIEDSPSVPSSSKRFEAPATPSPSR